MFMANKIKTHYVILFLFLVSIQVYASGVTSFEPVIFNPGWGIFTIPLYYEGGVLEPLQDSDSLSFGMDME